MKINQLFVSDVTRDIPPVVYFHEQTPEKLRAEVTEYIITGGWPEDHPNHRRVPNGIHEQYVHLLRTVAAELDKPGGPELPTVWVSGFYGSGKSSFAKLLGLALDGATLPDGTPLSDALLARDSSPKARELAEAWEALRGRVDPVAVVFDVGGVARDNEQIHSVAIRQVQKRLGYCSSDPIVADFELDLERDGHWEAFEAKAKEVLGVPWADVKDKALAEEDFSLVMSELYPEKYTDPMSWYTSRAGTHLRSESPEEAVAAIRDMLRFRRPGATLFLVVDEVSQYILSNKDRVDRLRAFATAIGAEMKGKVWLMALGQQKLDEEADDSFLIWAKDRFPPRLRVHLAATNIRDVVHKRLLQKNQEGDAALRTLFDKHRADLKLFAYGCDTVTPDEFVEVYPLLPGHVDLLLKITSALRTRSARAQGDDQAIRGLLQLLGELFREQKLAEMDLGALVTLDQVYEVQHTALDSDVQASMARILRECVDDASGLLTRVAKAVALLELVQESEPTDARLVARCLYDRIERGDHQERITKALEELRSRNLVGYSEKTGYRIQSTAGEEWERERRDVGVARETVSEKVLEALKFLLAKPERPKLSGRPFPWAGLFSDGRQHQDSIVVDPRDDASVRVDFRLLGKEERLDSVWVRRSAETQFDTRLVWVASDSSDAEHHARELARSQFMVQRYLPRKESLPLARKMLLQQEETRTEELHRKVRDAVAAAWMAGTVYFRGRSIPPTSHGTTFDSVLHGAATSILPELYTHFISTQVAPTELMQLLRADLSGPSPKFLAQELGILDLDSGRYVPSCGGVVPRRILEHLEKEGGLGGTTLLACFGGPPYGYTANVVKACIAGLVRAGKLRIQTDGGVEITAIRDAGVQDLFDKDRPFKAATFFPAGEDGFGPQVRAKICRFFEDALGHAMDREEHAIADAVANLFPAEARRLRELQFKWDRLPGRPPMPSELEGLAEILEKCVASARQTRPTVRLVKQHLDKLRDGVTKLRMFSSELTDELVSEVRRAAETRDEHVAQLRQQGLLTADLEGLADTVGETLDSDCPWRTIGSVTNAVDTICEAYKAARTRILEEHELRAQKARAVLKARSGFDTLTPEQSHRVLRPIAEAAIQTDVDAVAPPLGDLWDRYRGRLRKAEEEANDRLDALLSEGEKPLVVPVRLDLRNREVATEAEVDALLSDLKERLMKKIREGARVRLTW